MGSTGRREVFRALMASAFGGLMMILAFPTLGWAFPVLVAWAPLLTLARDWGWKRRFWAGWLMGIIYQLVLFRWIGFTLEHMTNLPGWSHVLLTAVFALWHGLMPALFLALSEPVRKVFERRWRGSGVIGLACLYVAVEWAWPFLFPWTIGHAFWQISALSSMMALTGAAGLSFVVLVVNGTLAELAIRRSWRPVRWALFAVVPLLLFGGVWSLVVNGPEARKTWRVAIVQPNYTLAEKKRMTPKVRRALLMKLKELMRGVAPGSADLIVAPEGGFPYFWQLGRTLDPMNPRHARHPMFLLKRIITEGPATPTIIGGLRFIPGKRIRNSAVLLGATGDVMAHYDKQILVPFGEYIPGRDLFPSLAKSVAGVSNLGVGEGACQFPVDGEIVTCGICYETIFTDFTWSTAGDASVLVNLTIDTWFGTSTAPYFHLMVQASRAAELGVPMLRAALTGVSAIVDADGVPRETLGLDREGVLRGGISIRDLTTPYRVIGPSVRWAMVFAALIALILAFRSARRARKERRGSEEAA